MSDSLSHSCPTCGGTGRRAKDGCGYGTYKCPDCIEGYPKDRIERAAKAMYDNDDAYDLPWEDQTERNGVRQWYRNMALAAIRAFHTEGTE